ncbi:MAG: hypothetical protein U0905_10425 [Pirellulales bacterium]
MGNDKNQMLAREEYVEQAYLFRILIDRLGGEIPLQELLKQVQHELLATSKLPMAVDFLLAELKHQGVMSFGMQRLSHYFTPFQTFLVAQAEEDRGRFDFKTALRILQVEAEYRSNTDNRQGFFFYQFEALSRNRLNYDRGLKAMSEDPVYTQEWKDWILAVRRQLGLIDLADLIYGRSQDFVTYRKRRLGPDAEAELPILFGEKEGKIAFANRRKDPLYLFAAMQRHLGYPVVPKLEPVDDTAHIVPQLQRRIERLESRIKLFEEEQRQGIDITKFYQGPNGPRLELPPDESF